MHKRPFRIDEEATKARNFASKFSYVSKRIHPDSDHQCEYLAGLDVARRRKQVFERDEYRCWDCGAHVTWGQGHMAHGGNTKVSRCDCMENLKTKCLNCHMIREHGREPRWGATA